MDDSESDIREDIGRKESERRLSRNMSSSNYLRDVIIKAGEDCDEIIETIEREQKARESTDVLSDAMTSVDQHVDEEDWYSRRRRTMPDIPQKGDRDDDQFRGTKVRSNKPGRRDEDLGLSSKEFLKARQDDADRVKALLTAGRRVAGGDMEDIQSGQAGASAQDQEGARAKEVFGRMGIGGGAANERYRVLKQMTKGVKKMTKDLE